MPKERLATEAIMAARAARCGPVPDISPEALASDDPEPRLAAFRRHYANFEIKTPKVIERTLDRGWMIPFLTAADMGMHRRWEHWFKIMMAGQLIDEPIPQLHYGPAFPRVRKMLDFSLDCVPRSGSWLGMGRERTLEYFVDWILYGFGWSGMKELPKEPQGCEGASMRLYQTFGLDWLQLWPHDYFGDYLEEIHYGQGVSFFRTPWEVAWMMTQMTMMPTGHEDPTELRTKTVCDPCVGTGIFLICASNFSYRLFGMDISHLISKVCVLNLYLYAPWGAKPFPFLEEARQEAEPERNGHLPALPEPILELPAPRRIEAVRAIARKPRLKRPLARV
jgi:hypothetical protein